MISIIIPQIITQIEIISPACWNNPCAATRPCGMGKGGGDLFTKRGSERGESGGEAAGEQALGTELSQVQVPKRGNQNRWLFTVSATPLGNAGCCPQPHEHGRQERGAGPNLWIWVLSPWQGFELPKTHTPPGRQISPEELADHAWGMPPRRSGRGSFATILCKAGVIGTYWEGVPREALSVHLKALTCLTGKLRKDCMAKTFRLLLTFGHLLSMYCSFHACLGK